MLALLSWPQITLVYPIWFICVYSSCPLNYYLLYGWYFRGLFFLWMSVDRVDGVHVVNASLQICSKKANSCVATQEPNVKTDCAVITNTVEVIVFVKQMHIDTVCIIVFLRLKRTLYFQNKSTEQNFRDSCIEIWICILFGVLKLDYVTKVFILFVSIKCWCGLCGLS